MTKTKRIYHNYYEPMFDRLQKVGDDFFDGTHNTTAKNRQIVILKAFKRWKDRNGSKIVIRTSRTEKGVWVRRIE